METCTEEVGLLRKKPCGKPMVTHCANCEQPLCTEHAVAQLTESGKKSGKFMCKACHSAQKEYAKTLAATEKKAGAAPAAAKPAAPAPKPAPAAAPKPAPAAAAAKPAAPAAPAAAKPAEAPKPGEKKPLSLEDTGPLEFTPSKPPEEKK
jgi:hypothetical protein